MPLRKNKKEYKVSGNRNLFSKKFWSKSKEVRIQIAMPKNKAPCVQSKEVGHLGKLQRGMQERRTAL